MLPFVRARICGALFALLALTAACDDSTTDPLPPGTFDAPLAFTPDSILDGNAIFVGGNDAGITVNMTSEDGLVIRIARGTLGNTGTYQVGTTLGYFSGFVRLPVNGTLVEYTLTAGSINVTQLNSRRFWGTLQATAQTSASGVPRATFTFTADIKANCDGACLF